jgi:hypothetical protein
VLVQRVKATNETFVHTIQPGKEGPSFMPTVKSCLGEGIYTGRGVGRETKGSLRFNISKGEGLRVEGREGEGRD